ncbi:hypothetical protein QZH41_012156 [Actinostola sp. cb2023]|nr:hypothetical protein QZH41_012156 [Actinostola sp. cb2023]
MLIALVAVLFLGISFSTTERSLTKVLQTTSGPIRGETVQLSVNITVSKYVGVSYGKAKRFQHSKQVKWIDVFDAVKEGKPCPQPKSAYGVQNLEETSEDCLNLNIYVPHTSSTNLPVMVFVSGVFYSFGSAHKLVHGVSVASRANTIFITMNYRLGMLGFLNTQWSHIKGNYGLGDKIEALKWIQRNIKRFGGNPNDVTLVGHSSGAMGVGLLLVSPQAQGLFKRAIMMSGSPLSPIATIDQSTAASHSRQIAKHFKCLNDSALTECLLTKTVRDIINAQQQFNNTPILVPFGPVVDGYIIPGMT